MSARLFEECDHASHIYLPEKFVADVNEPKCPVCKDAGIREVGFHKVHRNKETWEVTVKTYPTWME